MRKIRLNSTKLLFGSPLCSDIYHHQQRNVRAFRRLRKRHEEKDVKNLTIECGELHFFDVAATFREAGQCDTRDGVRACRKEISNGTDKVFLVRSAQQCDGAIIDPSDNHRLADKLQEF